MKKPLLNLKFILSLILCVTCMVGLMMPAMASGEGEVTQLEGNAQEQQNALAQQQNAEAQQQNAEAQQQQNAEAQQQNAEAQQQQNAQAQQQNAEAQQQNAEAQQQNVQAQEQQNAQEQQQNTQLQNTQQNTEAQQQQNTQEQQTTSNEQQNGQEAGQNKEAAVTEEENKEEQEEQQAENLEDPDSANIDGIYYHLDKENLTATIFGGHAATIGETLVIPASVKSPRSRNTYKVTAVEDNAFRGSAFAGIKHLTIEEGIERIGNVCFYGLQVEETLVIPDSVTYIGDWSFGMGAFKKLVMGNGLVNMGSSVFAYGQFEEVEIAHDTKLLGYYAFNKNNTKINKITFEGVRDVNRHVGDDTVTELYPTAFQGVQIGDVYLPDAAGEDTVKKNVMTYLGRVNTVADFFHWRDRIYHVEDGALYEVQGNTLKLIDTIMDYNDRDLTIPAEITIRGEAYAVTEIGPAAFARNAASSDKSPMTFTLDYNENLTIAKDAFAGLRIEKIVIKGEEGSMDAQFEGLTGIEQDQLDYTIKNENTDDGEDVEVAEAEVYNAAWLQAQIDEGKEVIALPELQEGEAINLEAPVEIGEGKKVTLVSNGKSVTVRGVEDIGDYAFYVKDGGSLTLQDAGIELTAPHGVINVENKAQFVLDAGTIEGGTIDKAANGAVRVYGASMTINGGRITGTTVTKTESAAVFVSGGGSLTMNGGKIDKNETTIEMEATAGGVLLYGKDGGADFTMNGGKITDNSSANGGGVVLMYDCTFNLNGGQICFNTARGWSGDSSYYSGFGGGVYVYGNAGREGTPEYSESAKSVFNMNGGEISNNSAKHGGGIFVDSSFVTLNAGSIVNNEAKYQGGGVYVSHEYRTMHVNNALITGNTARKELAIVGQDNTGMGGGLWACPTGAAVLHARNGVAIFDNKAEGAGDDVVSVNVDGYDIKTRLNSRITGGGSVEYYWDGRVRSKGPSMGDLTGHVVRTNPARYTPENIVVPFDPQNPQDEDNNGFAAKAFVSDADKASARANANLVISANSAPRGGGIATNGNVIFGAQGGIALQAEKRVNGRTPVAQEVFTFELVDAEGNVVQSKQNNGEKILFDDLIFKSTGTYTYTVREVKGTEERVTYDETEYKVTFTVTDEGGEGLTTDIRYEKDGAAHKGKLLFENKYEPEIIPASVQLRAEKRLNGGNPGTRTFRFELRDAEGKSIETVQNNGASITFPAMKFDKEGTYTYTVREIAGNERGVTYDRTVYTATVTVTAETSERGDVTYTAKVTWSSGADPVFNNREDPPDNPPPNNPPPNNPPPENPPQEPPVPNEPPQVLGVRRTDGAEVLGARRGMTGDSGKSANVATLAAALTALAVLIAGGRKEKQRAEGE